MALDARAMDLRIGNYVFVDDVVEGHVAALLRG